MDRNQVNHLKNTTSKLPRNLKPFFEEMDLIDQYGSMLAGLKQPEQGLDCLTQILQKKYEDPVDLAIFTSLSSVEKFDCIFTRVNGRVSKNPHDPPDFPLTPQVTQVLEQKKPLLKLESKSERSPVFLLVPILAGQRVIGLIQLRSQQEADFEERDLFFLDGLAQIVAPALVNSSSKYSLNEVYEIMVEAWGRAVDEHEGESAGHCLRVADLTKRLATRIGVRGERITALWRGAMLHDLGKLGISDSILFKSSALDLKEWEEMRRHPTFAYDIIRRVPFLVDSQDIPYSHHEKWDGTGYPRGLRGEEIPLAARIYALVDVWDALLSDRPYRSAWKRETAVEFLRNNLGSHFDPVLGQEFLRMIEEEPVD